VQSHAAAEKLYAAAEKSHGAAEKLYGAAEKSHGVGQKFYGAADFLILYFLLNMAVANSSLFNLHFSLLIPHAVRVRCGC
jgi:hypothetical protein